MFNSKRDARKLTASRSLEDVNESTFDGAENKLGNPTDTFERCLRSGFRYIPETTARPRQSPISIVTQPQAPLQQHPLFQPLAQPNAHATLAASIVIPEMADEAFGPPLFSGDGTQDARSWLNTLNDFIAYKGLTPDKALSLFKLRLSSFARDWLAKIVDGQKDSHANMSAAFLERFQPRELERFKFAKDLFNVKQEQYEPVDQYITKLRKKAAVVGLDAQLQLFAALNGLLPEISSYVMEHNPTDLDGVIQHGRVAELTRLPRKSAADEHSNQLMRLTEELSRLSSQVSNMAIANVT